MNLRIRQLAEQAGLGQERWDTTEQFNSFLEKFAELIVNECMNIVENHPIDPADMQYNMRIIPYMIEVQEKMKLHFGVE